MNYDVVDAPERLFPWVTADDFAALGSTYAGIAQSVLDRFLSKVEAESEEVAIQWPEFCQWVADRQGPWVARLRSGLRGLADQQALVDLTGAIVYYAYLLDTAAEDADPKVAANQRRFWLVESVSQLNQWLQSYGCYPDQSYAL